MLKICSNILGSLIAHSGTGEIFGEISGFIFDPDTGKLLAFWAETRKFFPSSKILLAEDIEEWKFKIYIKDFSCLADPEEIVKIKKIIEKEIFIFGNRVKTKNKVYLGKVSDCTFDETTLALAHIYVEKSFLGISYSKKIIPVSKIIKITKKAIIINNDKKYAKIKKEDFFRIDKILDPKPDMEPT